MAKKNIGATLALYPCPVIVVGAMVNDKPTWTLVAHAGTVAHSHLMVSLVQVHYINKGIRENKKLSVNVVDESWLAKADKMGTISGNKEDKSEAFAWIMGENGVPLIDEAKVSIECEVDGNYELENFDHFICKILATYADEAVLNEQGKIDYHTFKPVADQEHGRYSYDYYRKSDTHEPECIYAGFTGDSVSIYRNSYSPENKVSERLLLESRLIYEDIFRTFIYDYKPIKPDSAEIYYSAYIWEENGELNMQITWDEWEEYLSMEKLIDHTYTLYDEITSAASSNNCYKLGKISINACSPHEYNVERDEVRAELYFPNKSTHPIKYDKKKWTEELRKHLTRDVEMEPV